MAFNLKPIKGKKGNITDVFYVMAILFATAITLFLIYFVWENIQGSLVTNLNASSEGIAGKMADGTTGGLKLFDAMFPLFMVGLIFFVWISAFFIKSHPFLFFFSCFVFLFAILIAAILANSYDSIVSSNASFAPYNADFPITNYLMNRLPIIAFLTVLVTAVILYSKTGEGGI